MRFWLRSIAAGAGVGFVVGAVVGGTLGRLLMRLVFLAEQDARGFTTAMGAIVGELTRTGTEGVYGFAGIAGAVLGAAYGVGRTLLPSRTGLRTAIYVTGVGAFMLGQIAFANRDDFAFLPVTSSLALVAGAAGLAAVPVPALVERLAPDRERHPGPLALALVVVCMAAFLTFAALGVRAAYGVQSQLP